MRADLAQTLMEEFAEATGLSGKATPRLYLWTDAFAVCNFLGLARQRATPAIWDSHGNSSTRCIMSWAAIEMTTHVRVGSAGYPRKRASSIPPAAAFESANG